MSASYFDSLETRVPEAREASQFTLLADLVAQAIDNAKRSVWLEADSCLHDNLSCRY